MQFFITHSQEQFCIFNSCYMQVFGLCEENGATGLDPSRYSENMCLWAHVGNM